LFCSGLKNQIITNYFLSNKALNTIKCIVQLKNKNNIQEISYKIVGDIQGNQTDKRVANFRQEPAFDSPPGQEHSN